MLQRRRGRGDTRATTTRTSRSIKSKSLVLKTISRHHRERPPRSLECGPSDGVPSLTAAAPFHVRSFVMVSRVEFDARADGRRTTRERRIGKDITSRNEKEMKARSVS